MRRRLRNRWGVPSVTQAAYRGGLGAQRRGPERGAPPPRRAERGALESLEKTLPAEQAAGYGLKMSKSLVGQVGAQWRCLHQENLFCDSSQKVLI